jgi:phosphoadenosine phosphosulfate reductase
MAHAKTLNFAQKVERALELIQGSFHSCPYIAFSGGKDSLVCLHLASRVKSNIPAIWSDDELEYPEQTTYIPDICLTLGIKLYITSGRRSVHADWFRPWTDRPFWREQLPVTINDDRPIEYMANDLGLHGVILGLRKEESNKRNIYLSKKHESYQTLDGMIRIHPISGWSVYDVWAYIISNNLYYNPVYDRLALIGVELSKQRVGPLPLSPGGHLREAYPEIYRRLLSRYGNRW